MRVFDAAVQKAYGGKRKISWFEVFAGEESVQEIQQLAARRHRRGVQGISRRHQRPAHHARRRRHPLAQRRAAPDARPLRLPAPRAMVHRRAVARETPGEGGHGHLPRKHRGHLRGHRIRRRGQGRFWTSSRRISEGLQKNPFLPAAEDFKKIRFGETPEVSRHRHQAGQLYRHAAPVPRRHPIRHHEQAQERHDCPQGQHHEVHRRRLSATGATRLAKEFFGAVEIDGGPWCKIPEGKPGAGIVIKDAIADITLPAGAHAPDGFRRHRHAELERRLLERRARRAGRRHRHRARRQHQLHHRPRHF